MNVRNQAGAQYARPSIEVQQRYLDLARRMRIEMLIDAFRALDAASRRALHRDRAQPPAGSRPAHGG